MLLVPEARRESLTHLVSHFPERRDATGALALVDGVQPLGDLPACAGGLLAGISKGHRGRGPQAHFLGPAAPCEPQHPLAGTSLRNDQIKVAAIAVFARFRGRHLARSQLARHPPLPLPVPKPVPKNSTA